MQFGAWAVRLVTSLLFLNRASGAGSLIVFGDSLSDNGNGSRKVYDDFFKQKNETNLKGWPQSPPYYGGRWSNGPVWPELAAQELGLSLQDYAIGGAPSGAGQALFHTERIVRDDGTVVSYDIPIPSMLDQVQNFTGVAGPGDVVAIWIGGNDYLNKPRTSPSAVVGAVAEATDSLVSNGFKTFVFVTTPTPDASSDLSSAFQENNDILREYVTSKFPESHPGAKGYLFDAAALAVDIVTNLQSYGFTSAEPCLQGYEGPPCANPDKHMLWDVVHPSAAAHRVVGASFARFMAPYLTADPVAAR